MGGYKIQRDEGLIDEALALEDAGVFSIVLECIPSSLAKRITESLKIPTIGIGSGPYCDGQILVLNDIIGLTEKAPKFVRRYLNMRDEVLRAIRKYITDVEKQEFPSREV